MRNVNMILILFLVVLILSCSSIYNVGYDYDREANLRRLNKYDWQAIPDELEKNERFMIERIKKVVDTHLEAKGMEATEERPDFLIATSFGYTEKLQIWSSGHPYGPPYGRYYYGPYPAGTVSSYYYEEGTLILDFIDPNSGNLIWRGKAKAYLGKRQTPEKLDKIVNEAVERILVNFPPASAK